MKTRYNKSWFLFIIRILIIACFTTCMLLFIFSYFIERSFKEYSIAQNISELNSVIDSIESELSYIDSNVDRNNIIQNITLILTSHPRLYVHIIDDHNETLYKTRGPNLLLALKQLGIDELIMNRSTPTWNYGTNTYRLAGSQFTTEEGKTYTIITAIGRDLQLQFFKRLHDGLMLLVLTSCVLVLFGTLLTIYYTQKPINSLIKKIESINSKSLNYRIPSSSVPTKYISLVKAFNNMLARMEEVFQRQNNFTADIAHEMRTPITNLTTQTQIALNNARTTSEYKEILYSNLEEFEKLSQIITDMLFLAQTDNKQLVPKMSEIKLDTLFNTMFEYFEPLSEDKNIHIKLEGNCNPIMGDKLMMSRAISNLLSNAIRYTPENKDIIVTLKQLNKNNILIVIANPGKKIDAYHLPHLFERFYRTDESRQRNGEGAGIGLAIVKSIIESHKGDITVESDEISTRFIITLPCIPTNKKQSKFKQSYRKFNL
ncbi:heavy metal sensor histidine kinase [Orbaceae bacterium ac157xtp]